MELDFLTLSRVQFALTIAFHYLFAPLNIGLGFLMVIMEGMYLRTGNKVYENMARFWTKLFGVTFAMGVATGIVMEFQFGTNWAVYSKYVGDVFGSALAAEGIFAFFLESGFLGILVFGWDRFKPRFHFFATCMVSLGSLFSAVWIIVANSWQQTPAGHHIVNGRAEIIDFWAVVFNPSSMIRLSHTVVAALTLGAFFVMSITAYYIIKNRHIEFSKKSFTIALIVAFLTSWLQLGLGHIHAQQVANTQPAKLAAMEGLFQTTQGGSPLTIFGIPDVKTETVKYQIAIPNLLSFLAHNNLTQPVTGLDKIPRDEWPPVLLTFAPFHIMVGIGMFFIALTSLSLLLLYSKKLFSTQWILWVFVVSVIAAYAANQLGWMAAEVGRQPWVVWGLLKTKDAFSPTVPLSHGITSFIIFSLLYGALFMIWIYVMNDKIHKGPSTDVHHATPASKDEESKKLWT